MSSRFGELVIVWVGETRRRCFTGNSGVWSLIENRIVRDAFFVTINTEFFQ